MSVTVGFAWPNWRETKTTFKPLAISSVAQRVQRVQREASSDSAEAGVVDGAAEGLADVAVVEAAAGRREDEVLGLLVGRGEPAFAQQLRDGGGEDDLASGGFGPEGAVEAVSGELAVDADDAYAVLHVGPAEAERNRAQREAADLAQGASAMTAVVGARTCSFAFDQAAT